MRSSWRRTTIGGELKLQYGKSLAAATRRVGSVPVFGSNGQVGVHDEACVDGPGIVVGRKGSAGAVTFSAAAFWPIDTTYYVENTGLHNWRFLYHLLSSLGLGALDNLGPVPGLNRDDAYGVTVDLPELPEQHQIAQVLDLVEGAVSIERKLVVTARELKAAAMRQLFTKGTRGEAQQETEIGAVPESWTLTPLGSVREFLQYGTSSKCDYAGGTPVLRIPNVVDGRIDTSDLKACHLSAKEVSSWLLETGDVLFIRTNGVRERVGRTAVYNGEPTGALFASYLIRARTQADTLLPAFLQYFTDTDAGVAQLGGQASPAADGKFNINTKTIDGLLVPLPKLDEQVLIVSSLRAIDDKIAVHSRKLAVLKELFGTLLNDLMTGRIRVTDLDAGVTWATAP